MISIPAVVLKSTALPAPVVVPPIVYAGCAVDNDALDIAEALSAGVSANIVSLNQVAGGRRARDRYSSDCVGGDDIRRAGSRAADRVIRCTIADDDADPIPRSALWNRIRRHRRGCR